MLHTVFFLFATHKEKFIVWDRILVCLSLLNYFRERKGEDDEYAVDFEKLIWKIIEIIRKVKGLNLNYRMKWKIGRELAKCE